MKRWVRRLVYLLITLVWLFIVSLPALAFVVAMNGQVQIGNDEQRHVRIFLLQDADAQGLGLEWARRAGDNCARTSIGYLLWEGEAEPVSFCQCYDPVSGDVLPAATSICE